MTLRVLCLVQLDDRDDTALTGTRFRTSRGFIPSQVPGLIVPKFHAITDLGSSVSVVSLNFRQEVQEQVTLRGLATASQYCIDGASSSVRFSIITVTFTMRSLTVVLLPYCSVIPL